MTFCTRIVPYIGHNVSYGLSPPGGGVITLMVIKSYLITFYL